MSTVTVSVGSFWNSGQLHETGDLTRPSIRNDHRSSGVCGVGPAESTGKSVTRYCPGGTRCSTSGGRRPPRNPREIHRAILSLLPFPHYERYADDKCRPRGGRSAAPHHREHGATDPDTA